MTERICAVIPARGGSKGLVGKHLRILEGRPLISWTIQAALGSDWVTDVVVTSDDAAILKIADQHGVQTITRPAALATDSARSEPVMLHALDAINFEPDVSVLLQPTSPLRTAADIDAALTLLSEKKSTSVISVVTPEFSPWKCFVTTEDGRLRGLVDDEAPFRPRQELPEAVRPNGAIYAVQTNFFRATGRLLGTDTVPYRMPRDRSVDIDTIEDFQRAAAWLRDRASSRHARIQVA